MLPLQFDADAAQAFGEEFRFAAEPEAQVAFEAQMRAGHDQHALVYADALGQLDNWASASDIASGRARRLAARGT